MSRRTVFSAQTLAVLAALVAEPSAWRHGYDLARETGLKSGTLYPILGRLADRGIVQACCEAGQVPAGWARLRWLAGGLWLVAREAKVVRKILYWAGVGAVAVAAAWAVWLSWRAVRAPYYDPQAVTDRVRVLTGAAALVALP